MYDINIYRSIICYGKLLIAQNVNFKQDLVTSNSSSVTLSLKFDLETRGLSRALKNY